MTDPQLSLDEQLASPSDASSDRALVSPAISISSVQYGGPFGATNHAQSHQESPGVSAAYATNPYSGGFGAFHLDNRHLSQGLHAHAAIYDQTTPNDIALQTNQNPALGTFGSQEWIPPVGPYLDFAPQPLYEPTGELINEKVDTFDHFDSPPSRRESASSQTRPALQATTQRARELNLVVNNPGAKGIIAPPPPLRSALKRKTSYDPNSPTTSEESRRKRSTESAAATARTVTFGRMSDSGRSPPGEGLTSPELTTEEASGRPTRLRPQRPAEEGSASRTSTQIPSTGPNPAGKASGHVYKAKPSTPSVLPPEKVFPIQIGSELFRLSGASISSDAPSYFTQFFEDQVRQNEESGGVRTLYIDRDPVTFRDVARHLQGYHIKPTDGSHFVKLFADAQFYSLPRLIDQLFESEIFIQIGDRNFQIPKDIFSGPGDSPNFFSLGFAVFFSTPGEVFPGLDRKGLLRPPSIVPPCVPGRSSEVFAELLHMLRGYPLHIRNQEHRAELLRDCRYFHLRGLEQKLIAHEISYNLERQRSEICLRLEDVKPSGVSFVSDLRSSELPTSGGWVNYARPFVDDTAYEMILEIGGESTVLDLQDMRADFQGLTKARVSSLFQVVANKMNLPTNAPLGLMMLSGGQSAQPASPGHTPLSEDRVKIRIERDTEVVLDGESYDIDWNSLQGNVQAPGVPSSTSEPNTDSEAMSETMSTRGMSRTSSSAGITQHRQPQRQGSVASETTPAQINSRLGVLPSSRQSGGVPMHKKRKRRDSLDNLGEWVVRTGQWRLRVQPSPQDAIRGGMEIVFVAVKLDAYSEERARNARRPFLS